MRLACGVVVLAAVIAGGCKETSSSSPSASSSSDDKPPGPSVTLRFAYSSEKKAWLDKVLPAFAASHPTTPSGKAIVVEARSFGSGEASAAILDGSFRAHVYSPASTAYLALLNDQWRTKHGKPVAQTSEPLVLSPIVIAMWKPMAEALGWPTKDIGWADIIRVSKDPKGWASLNHPEWGQFKLGHTHPEYSNSGLLAVLAEAFAGAGKTRDLTRADLESPKTRAFIHSIEDAIVHYGKSTGLFTDQMLDHGPGYISAAVTYENLVIESYTKPTNKAPFPVVAIYPVEGTFWSDHPYAVLDTDDVGADEKAAGQQLLAFLKKQPQQEAARALGFRPADPKLAITAPLDEAHGVDPKQPQTLLELPNASVLSALLEAWRDQKKTAEVTIVFDRSGSMTGEPLAQAKQGAKAFINGLGDKDLLSILFFSTDVAPAEAPEPLATTRARRLRQVDNVFASGNTRLYDAIDDAYALMLARATKEPGKIHAIVVMTDGKDETSNLPLDQLNAKFNPENAPVKIFTIAYGDSADPAVLQSIASAAQGTSVKGSASTIVEVYRDLSAFF